MSEMMSKDELIRELRQIESWCSAISSSKSNLYCLQREREEIKAKVEGPLSERAMEKIKERVRTALKAERIDRENSTPLAQGVSFPEFETIYGIQQSAWKKLRLGFGVDDLRSNDPSIQGIGQWLQDETQYDGEEQILTACRKHDERFSAYMERSREMAEESKKGIYDGYTRELDKCNVQIAEKEKEIEEIQANLDRTTVIPSRYFDIVGLIIEALNSDQVNDLASALQIAIAENARVEAEIERDFAAQEQRRHNEAMEREARRAESEMKRQAERLCENCAYRYKCSYTVKGKNPNCANYFPK